MLRGASKTVPPKVVYHRLVMYDSRLPYMTVSEALKATLAAEPVVTQEPQTEKYITALGEYPDQQGDLPVLNAIRYAIAECDPKGKFSNLLLITAPHRHWLKGQVNTQEYVASEKKYLLGPLPIDNDAMLLPISYVFIDGNAIPHEFVLPSELAHVTVKELLLFYEGIESLAKKDCRWDLFGVALNYRFRFRMMGNLMPNLKPTLEDMEAGISVTRQVSSATTESFRVSQIVGWDSFLAEIYLPVWVDRLIKTIPSFRKSRPLRF